MVLSFSFYEYYFITSLIRSAKWKNIINEHIGGTITVTGARFINAEQKFYNQNYIFPIHKHIVNVRYSHLL